ncbi:hypothetical protein ATC1_13497 [Flexilinea flocculi]|uniref:Uncharacterized protein n=1 Tax=Flexilinea flocculi TaxID=1678840 RepID=A0A0S7BUQ0_9CHLR|nr:hypothetical protein ATC1_13497 [Flexilinea flocculi]
MVLRLAYNHHNRKENPSIFRDAVIMLKNGLVYTDGVQLK